MMYSKQEGKYLTARINYVFSEMMRLSGGLQKEKSELSSINTKKSASVGPVGLEPTANGL